MQAIILAAGMGKRLKALTKENTKCMVKVNGITMIERMLRQLEPHQLSRIIIVVGYKGDELKDFIRSLSISTEIIFVENKDYDKTNNIYSLALASDALVEDDTILLESDLIFEDSVLEEVIKDDRPNLALVDKYESWMDGTVVKLDSNDSILEFIPGSKFEFDDIKNYYKTVNVYKFSKDFSKRYYVPFLDAYSKALGKNEYYEQVLKVLTMIDIPVIKAKRLNGQKWYEIDDVQDLDIASTIFSPKNKIVDKIHARYGGYWRYPKMLDFCYLVNPYFPPQRMLDEIKANFETLIAEYPSGLEVNNLLAAKAFGIRKEQIVVGNGAAELIKSLMAILKGNVGVIWPTFEEYPNRIYANRVVKFYPDTQTFKYTSQDLIDFYTDKNISAIILINPDNPTGQYMDKNDVIKLASWCDEHGIYLVLDESFTDFVAKEAPSVLSESVLDEHEKLIVVKSISKSYGVPGIRLGICATSDASLLAEIKRDVAIWNINSFGEFYLQIYEKYARDYNLALDKIKRARKDFELALSKIKDIKVYSSQANYIMIELLGKVTCRELVETLLIDYDILIKDLSAKKISDERKFIRIAVRNTEDNNILIKALEAIFKKVN